MTVYYKMWQILLQNATAILLQNASGFLLENATVSLQNATVITNCDHFIAKCDVYYKLRQYSLALMPVIDKAVYKKFHDSCNKSYYRYFIEL